jgi:universal stress protein A
MNYSRGLALNLQKDPLVPNAVKEARTMTGTRILCPVDFSEFSDAAMATAVPLTRARSGQLFLLHVVEPLSSSCAGQTVVSFTDNEYRELQSRLNDTLSQIHDFPIERYMEYGNAADKILEFAQEHEVNLIVLGTHGRSGMTRAAMGSVAEKVVRSARCAVLSVKQPDETLQLAGE